MVRSCGVGGRTLLGACAALALLSACGGGGGSGPATNPQSPVTPTPSPAPTPTPTPAPTPTPTPTPTPSGFQTAEYQRSNSLGALNVLSAYEAGADGSGVIVGIMDSGIDRDSSEFAGRIHAASADFGGNGSFEDPDGHGTLVASALAGAKNDAGTHGVAFNATLFVARTESYDAGQDEFIHFDSNIARGLDAAVAAGAKVVNMSLGGTPASPQLSSAIQRATAAGVIIVISAGNYVSDPSDPNYDPGDTQAQPDAFPLSVIDPAIGNGLVVIAGATTDAGVFASAFSKRAGSYGASYLVAPGQQLRMVGLNEQQLIASGTSFSAPQISGALALLLDAFPSLTPQQAVDLLFDTATDLGDPGIDSTYGSGLINLAEAFSAQGTMRLPSGQSAQALDLGQLLVRAGAPLGDAAAVSAALADVVVLDAYGRPFSADLGGLVQRGAAPLNLAERLREDRLQSWRAAAGGRIAVSSAASGMMDAPVWGRFGLTDAGQPVRGVLAPSGQFHFAPTPDIELGVTFGLAPADISAAAPSAAPALKLFSAGAHDPLSVQAGVGAFGLSASLPLGGQGALHRAAGHGESGPRLDARRGDWADAPGLSQIQIGLSQTRGALSGALALVMSEERGSFLGLQSAAALPLAKGGRHVQLAPSLAAMLGDVQLRAAGTIGVSWADEAAGGGGDFGRITTSRFDVRADVAGVFARDDALSLRLLQPLRVEAGALALSLPVAFDYGANSAVWETRAFSLAPSGRELAVEAAYAWPDRVGGRWQVNGFARREPGHVAEAAADIGGIIQWRRGF